jgi:glutathione synthase/RimK-type ligase-like ATP-grasp enzyme
MPAAIPVLLVSTATRWYGTARTPRALAKAGFEVTLLTPRNSLAESSRFVTRVAYLPDTATPLEWIHAVAATVRAVSPRQIMPCDDVSFRLLAMLALSPPPQMQPALQAELAGLVRASLGSPEHYRASVDKTLICEAAARAGVRVPEHAVIGAIEEATAFADRHGYPVVVKRPYTTAGDGVRIVADSRELASAVADLVAPKLDDLEPEATRRLLIQKYIAGNLCYQNVAAWQGRYLAGYAGDRIEAYGGPMTPGTVVRYHDSSALRDFAVQLVEAFGMSGLFASEYVVEKSTGLPYLIEINRRISPGTHFGAVMNVDLCAALHAAMQGIASPTRGRLDPGEERIFVQFPLEWLRNPQSPWLRRHPVDVPWDDPELLDAMLALRNER